MEFGIPVCYYDGKKIKPETYNVVEVIKRKLMCINEEIDYFYDTIIDIVQKIYENGGFTENITYQFILMETTINIHNIFNRDENNPCYVYNVMKEHKMRGN